MKVLFLNKNLSVVYSFLLITILLVSCNNSKPVERIPAEQIAAEPAEPLPEPAPKTVTSNGNLAINPAHGEPGHRCDIQVGAPLPGAATTVNPAIFEASQQTAPTQQAVSSNLNPAHGEPGHRCDIPVGSPL